MSIDADLRFAAGAGGVARFLADAAGLESTAIAHLQTAVVTACREAFGLLRGKHPHLDITFTRFTDRLEVALSHSEETSTGVNVDTVAGFATQNAPGGASPGILAGVDRIQYETHGAEAVTRLTKYLSQTPPNL